MIVAGSDQGIVMVEAGAQQVTEEEVLGRSGIRPGILQEDYRRVKPLVAAAGKPKKDLTARLTRNCFADIDKKVREELKDALDTKKHSKLESYALVDALNAA